ncbi:MAG: HAMP domain-containing histidine kinase [Acidobacteria bacterium]|nr:HAMP domain-containing histidine kinase [Acidobacteriota bacterium]
MPASFDRWWNGISLRAKITGVTVLLLTFGLAVAGAGTVSVLRGYLMDQRDNLVNNFYANAQSYPEANVASCKVAYQPNGTLFAVLDANGKVLCSNIPAGTASPDTKAITLPWVIARDANATTELPKTTIADATGKSHWRVIAAPLTDNTVYTTLVVGLSVDDVDSTVARFILIFFGFALAVVVFGAATTQLLVTSTFAPLRDVEATAARFAAGDYSQRLGGATPNTEVGRLNRSLNTMLARIDRAFADRQRTLEQMRRFVGDASHELRTPLVSLRGYAELYRMGAITNPEDVAQAMDRIEREAIRMGTLVQDLLELARLDEAKPLRLEPVDLLPIAQDAALDATAGNPGRRITVVVAPSAQGPGDSAASAESRTDTSTHATAADGEAGTGTGTGAVVEPAAVTGSLLLTGAIARLRRRRPPRAGAGSAASPLPATVPIPDVGPIVLAEGDKVRQVVTNLMGNAMRFTPSDSPIELVVEVDREGGYGQLSIVDHGEGIPPQLREKIFQRFWRADTSRTRDTGGSGLGLAIVAGIVANHNGHVEMVETPGGGATFRVSLPLLPSEPETEPLSGAAAGPTETSSAS